MNLHKLLVIVTTIALFGYVLSDSNCTMGHLTDSQGNCTAENTTTTTESPATSTTETISTTPGSTRNDESIIIENLFKPYSVLPARTFLPDYVDFEDIEEEMVDEMIQFVTCPEEIIGKNGSCILNNTVVNTNDATDNECVDGFINAITGQCIDEWGVIIPMNETVNLQRYG